MPLRLHKPNNPFRRPSETQMAAAAATTRQVDMVPPTTPVKRIDSSASTDTLKTSATFSTDAPRKSVRFFPLVQVQQCLHLNDYKERERKDTWYTVAEKKAIKDHIRAVIMVWEKTAPLTSPPLGVDNQEDKEEEEQDEKKQEREEHWTIRGLEHYTQDGSYLRDTNLLKVLDAVLIEQTRQQQEQKRRKRRKRRTRRPTFGGCAVTAVSDLILESEEHTSDDEEFVAPDEALAEASRRISRASQERAQQIGKQDELAVLEMNGRIVSMKNKMKKRGKKKSTEGEEENTSDQGGITGSDTDEGKETNDKNQEDQASIFRRVNQERQRINRTTAATA